MSLSQLMYKQCEGNIINILDLLSRPESGEGRRCIQQGLSESIYEKLERLTSKTKGRKKQYLIG